MKLSLVLESKIYRESISNHLNALHGMSVISSFALAVQATRNIDQCLADVVLIDGNADNVFQLISSIKDTHPNKKVVLLVFKHDSLAEKYISMGVEGIVSNNDCLDDLKNCISTVHSGHLCYPNQVADLFQNNATRSQGLVNRMTFKRPILTSRQTIVMQHIAKGLTNKEIARKLNIELSTVKNHVHQILERLQVKNRSQAAAQYRKPTQHLYS